METHVTLEYPNGRRVHTTLRGLYVPGMEFELYGRHWRVIETLASWGRWPMGDQLESMPCRPSGADSAPL